MQRDPAYADEVRQDPKAFKPKKDRAGKPKEDAFEQWVDSIANPTPEKVEEKPFDGQTLTFEDIKPYVSMYKGDDGKTVYDVLDKDEKSVYRTSDSRLAMHYLSKNFNALRQGTAKAEMPAGWESKSLKEARTKIVETIKSKVTKEDTGLPGRPKIGVSPIRPKARGLPGFMATFQNSISCPIFFRLALTRS